MPPQQLKLLGRVQKVYNNKLWHPLVVQKSATGFQIITTVDGQRIGSPQASRDASQEMSFSLMPMDNV